MFGVTNSLITYKGVVLWKIFKFLRFKKNIEGAKKLFQKEGLAFPAIPEELASQLKEQDEWVFSTRKVKMWSYNLQEYVNELNRTDVEDYVVLSHAGHGTNSYALQYYLVHGKLKMFLHLGWGGVHMDNKSAKDQIRDCFLLTDKIVLAAQTSEKLQEGTALKIVCSDFYGSYWSAPGVEAKKEDASSRKPEEVLREVLYWLET